MSGMAMAVFGLVLGVHVALIASMAVRTLTITSSEKPSAGNGPLRVRLVMSRPELAAPQPMVPPPPQPPLPPQPKPDKKILSSEAPSPRVVEAAKPQPAPAQVPTPMPIAPNPVPPNPMPAPQLAVVPALAEAPSPAVTPHKSDATDAVSLPKQVGQIDCRVPKPDYPRAARRRGEAGTVTIRLTVDEHGQVSAALDRSSGFPDLDASARRAAESAQCKPYIEGGKPIRVTALQPIHFVPAD